MRLDMCIEIKQTLGIGEENNLNVFFFWKVLWWGWMRTGIEWKNGANKQRFIRVSGDRPRIQKCALLSQPIRLLLLQPQQLWEFRSFVKIIRCVHILKTHLPHISCLWNLLYTCTWSRLRCTKRCKSLRFHRVSRNKDSLRKKKQRKKSRYQLDIFVYLL